MLRYIKDKERIQLMNDVHNESNLFTKGGNFNQKYKGRLEYVDNHSKLTEEEKILLKQRITRNKDVRNLLEYKTSRYPCLKCGRSGYAISACEHCCRDSLKRNFENWTSGNTEIDEIIRSSQLRCPLPWKITEWIEPDKLRNIEKVDEGGFATIYTAEWTEGPMDSFDTTTQTFNRFGPIDVILKRFKNFSTPNKNFLAELETHILLDSNAFLVVKVYGISRYPESGDFILIMEGMECDLKTYIRNNHTLTKKEVYNIFFYAFTALGSMHIKGIIHRDFHYGNLLKSFSGIWVISDFGLSGAEKKDQSVYGMLEFIPPEVIRGEPFTLEGDIYSCGMLMYFIATGNTPFHDFKGDNKLELTLHITNGGRPLIPDYVPKPYMVMMSRCWHDDPYFRPSVNELTEFAKKQFRSATKNDIIMFDREGSKTNILSTSKSSIYNFGDLNNSSGFSDKSEVRELFLQHAAKQSGGFSDGDAVAKQSGGFSDGDAVAQYLLKHVTDQD